MVVLIDAHTHIGRWNADVNYSREDLFNVLDKNGVEFFVVSNLSGRGQNPKKGDKHTYLDEKEANAELVQTFKNFPQAVLLAVCEPNHGKPDTIRYLLTRKYKGKFSGLKFHPDANQLPADSELYDGYMKIAEDYDLPVLIHCGDLNSPYCSPELVYNLAKRHPKVKVIMGHLSCGDPVSKYRAMEIMQESVRLNNSTLYCDISWNGPVILSDLIKYLPTAIDRILFGSDAPMNNTADPKFYNYFANVMMQEVDDKYPEMKDELIQKIFYTNAVELFKIKK